MANKKKKFDEAETVELANPLMGSNGSMMFKLNMKIFRIQSVMHRMNEGWAVMNFKHFFLLFYYFITDISHAH